MSRPRSRAWRWFFASGLLLVGAALVVVAWLLRDPEPYFLTRRSVLLTVDTMPSRIDETAREQEVTVHGANGLTVSLAVRRPLDSDPGLAADTARRHLYVLLGGQSRGKDAGALVGDTRGNVFASIEYPYDGNARANGMALVREVPAIRRAFLDTPPSVMLALDYLLTLPDVDTAHVELVGASFGAPFATIVAALDPRVTRLWLAHGGGESYRLLERGLERRIGWAPLRALTAGTANLVVSGPRLSPEKWIARVSPRPVVMLNADDDERIPRRSVDALWNAAREPKQMVWLPGLHLHAGRPETLEELVVRMFAIAGQDSVRTP